MRWRTLENEGIGSILTSRSRAEFAMIGVLFMTTKYCCVFSLPPTPTSSDIQAESATLLRIFDMDNYPIIRIIEHIGCTSTCEMERS